MDTITTDVRESFKAALPIVLGYIAIGIPCGILSDSIGLDALQAFLMSVLFYSGAGQFMIPNMYLAGAPLASIIASVSFVNTRQMLYSAAFAPQCVGVKRRLAFFFAATVTDESYGVNTLKFEEGGWTVRRALFVNLFSCASWTVSNVVGVLVGSAIGIPLAIASFAMTSIFICLLCTQKLVVENVVAAAVAMLGVFVFKLVGLTGPAILLGAVMGVAAALCVSQVRRARSEEDALAERKLENALADAGAGKLAGAGEGQVAGACARGGSAAANGPADGEGGRE